MRSTGRRVGMVAVAALAATLTVTAIQSAAADPSPPSSVFVPIAPCRLFDTRPGDTNVGPRATPLGTGETHTVDAWGANGNCTLPSDATAVSMNVVAIEPTASSFLTVWPAGAERPNASNLNWTAGQAPTPNAVTSALSDAGRLSLFNLAGTVHLAADVVGYWTSDATIDPGPAGAPGPTGPAGPQGPAGVTEIDPSTIVWVAPDGGDFTDLSEALASITDNGPNTPYLVQLAPGTYEETDAIELGEWIELRGSGPGTVIRTAPGRNLSETISITGSHVTVRDLTIDSGDDVGISAAGVTDVDLSDLDVEVAGIETRRGIAITNAEVSISGTTVAVSGGSTMTGIKVDSGAALTVERSTVTIPATVASATCNGVHASGSEVVLTDVSADMGGCGAEANGVRLDAGASGELRRVRMSVAVTSAGLSQGVRVSLSTAIIDESDIREASLDVLPLMVLSGTVLVRDSTLVGVQSGYAVMRYGGDVRVLDTVLGGNTFSMAGRCVDVTGLDLGSFTCQ